MTALGVLLLVLGAVVIVAENHVPSLGLLGGPGVVMLTVGALLAISGLGGGLILSLFVALLLGTAAAGIVLLSVREGMAVRRRRIRTGREGLIGHIGVVRSWADVTGSVLVDGALWRARRTWPDEDEDEPDLHEGDPVVVERLNGLTLAVRRAEDWELAP